MAKFIDKYMKNVFIEYNFFLNCDRLSWLSGKSLNVHRVMLGFGLGLDLKAKFFGLGLESWGLPNITALETR